MTDTEEELLVADPDLAAGIEPDRLETARHACTATVVALGRGPWDPVASGLGAPGESDAAVARRGFGLLVLSGFLVRRVDRGGRRGAELVGVGDLLRPWQTIGSVASTPFEASWSVVAPARLAVLDAKFVARAAPFPSVAVALVDRAMLRSRHLALTLAIVQQPRVDRRLHWLFWHLADRWGRTGPEGARVELPLTHALLGELVAARRPSVTTALASLGAEGKVERDGRSWLLRGGPPADYAGPPAG